MPPSETPAQGAASTPPKQTETRQSIEHGLLLDRIAISIRKALEYDGKDFRWDKARQMSEVESRQLGDDLFALRALDQSFREVRGCLARLLECGFDVPPLWIQCSWEKEPEFGELRGPYRGFWWRVVEFGEANRHWLQFLNEVLKRLDAMMAGGEGASADTEGVAGDAAPKLKDNISWQARAITIITEHPKMTTEAVAKSVGVHRVTLQKCEAFRTARRLAQKQGGVNVYRGWKDKETGEIEGIDGTQDDERDE